MKRYLLVVMSVVIVVFSACSLINKPSPSHPVVDRESKIPGDVHKRVPETDQYPPILHSDDFEEPIPLPYPINTAGAEDSAFILPDGNTLYFFFTPDVRVPHKQQVLDEVSGIWVTHLTEMGWSKPTRVWLQEPGKLALDGAVCIQDDEMWFASAREGYTGVNMFTARFVDGKWTDWRYVGDRLMKEVQIGEVHIHGDDLYFHSSRPDGQGSYDIWLTTRSYNEGLDPEWADPVNIHEVNSEEVESLPFVTSDGNELWFTRRYLGTPAVFRSIRSDGEWGEPELIVSQFAGEPTLDDAGNLYFIHHFYEFDEELGKNVMIEADIYFAYRK